MEFLIKALGAFILFAVFISAMVGWFDMFILGQYYVNAPIHMTLLFGFAWPAGCIIGFCAICYAIVKS
jgi:hypothetical protein